MAKSAYISGAAIDLNITANQTRLEFENNLNLTAFLTVIKGLLDDREDIQIQRGTFRFHITNGAGDLDPVATQKPVFGYVKMLLPTGTVVTSQSAALPVDQLIDLSQTATDYDYTIGWFDSHEQLNYLTGLTTTGTTSDWFGHALYPEGVVDVTTEFQRLWKIMCQTEFSGDEIPFATIALLGYAPTTTVYSFDYSVVLEYDIIEGGNSIPPVLKKNGRRRRGNA